MLCLLLLLPQRYIFSSKSQQKRRAQILHACCCCYHKGTYFQANHNWYTCLKPCFLVVVATTKVHIFKQITTLHGCVFMYASLLLLPQRYIFSSKSQLYLPMYLLSGCCCCYHKGTYFQANHNQSREAIQNTTVVVATTKVHIFKQITTGWLLV